MLISPKETKKSLFYCPQVCLIGVPEGFVTSSWSRLIIGGKGSPIRTTGTSRPIGTFRFQSSTNPRAEATNWLRFGGLLPSSGAQCKPHWVSTFESRTHFWVNEHEFRPNLFLMQCVFLFLLFCFELLIFNMLCVVVYICAFLFIFLSWILYAMFGYDFIVTNDPTPPPPQRLARWPRLHLSFTCVYFCGFSGLVRVGLERHLVCQWKLIFLFE